MTYESTHRDASGDDDVVADFSPKPTEETPEYGYVLHNDNGGVAECCDRIRQKLLIHQLVFHSFVGGSVIREGLLRQDPEVTDRLAADFHRLVILDVACGLDADGVFQLPTFYRYAFEQLERTFEIPSALMYHEQDLLQILKDEPTSLICLVNVDVADSPNRKRLRSLTQEGHPSLIVFRAHEHANPSGNRALQGFLSVAKTGAASEIGFELLDHETTIGRHPECTIRVNAGAVSRYHAKVTRRPDGFVVEDSGSRNGTYLNGKRLIEPQFLREGDSIRVSDVELVFQHEPVPGIARGSSEFSFDGDKLDIMVYDEVENDFLDSGSGPTGSGPTGAVPTNLKMSATPEAKLEALIRINSNLSNALAVDEVLPKILESLFDIFPAADRGFVVMENEERDLIPGCVKVRAAHDETETARISRTIIREAMASGEALLSMDAAEDNRFDSSQSIADFSIRSLICAPLLDGERKPFGAIQIDSTQGRGQFREEDTDLMSAVAAQAGIVISNAKMRGRALQQKELKRT